MGTLNGENMRIIFMGTPEFAVPSLRILLENNLNVVAVVTAPDKPGGRHGLLQSAVKKFAVERGLPVLQPEKLKNPGFLAELRSFKADLQIVVAFRMLPELVWAMPPLGTFNLHGSLLPKYRGAAPINWAVINGETETGCTTFFLKHEIDTGDLLFVEKIAIGPDDNAGEIHDNRADGGIANQRLVGPPKFAVGIEVKTANQFDRRLAGVFENARLHRYSYSK